MHTNTSASYLTEEEMARRDKHVDAMIRQSKLVGLVMVAVGIYYAWENFPHLYLSWQHPEIWIGGLFIVAILTPCFFMSISKWKRKKFDDMKVSYEAVVKRSWGQKEVLTLLYNDGKKQMKKDMFVGDDIAAKANALKNGDTVRVIATEQYGLVLDIEKIDAPIAPAYAV
jgi:hypothetical protein